MERQARAEIQVTPEMVAAGWRALFDHDIQEDSEEEVVISVFTAMAQAQQTHLRPIV